MNESKAIHHLSHVDHKLRKAVCSVCGPVQIVLINVTKQPFPEARCMNRVRESAKANYSHKRSSTLNRKPRHVLSEINHRKLTAICAICGPTDIRKRKRGDIVNYRCATYKKSYAAEYRRLHSPTRQPRTGSNIGHVLSNVNDKRRTAICSTCGPVEIYIWRTNRGLRRRCINASHLEQKAAYQRRKAVNRQFISEYVSQQACRNCRSRDNVSLYTRDEPIQEGKLWKFDRLGRGRLLVVLAGCQVLCRSCFEKL